MPAIVPHGPAATTRAGFICDSGSLGDLTAQKSRPSPSSSPALLAVPSLSYSHHATPSKQLKAPPRTPAERVLRDLQATARRLLNDPDLTQTSAFVTIAPLIAFVYLFIAGAAALRFADTLHRLDASAETVCILVLGGGLAFLLGGLFVLGLLRACIYGIASTGRALAETDIDEWMGGNPRLMEYEVLFGGLTIATEKP
ncbi:uncharacterized protein SCHCODRAFT_02604158 [Schizophyllum commune H4-8]|nr:uncharacterized protein SCHCODRAFT_02604158 [Schizophyllum commune H4-8]KAI5899094.1 hypothetical protein SCHCODRAFT_02604158 [Schizophyllum commune H4-8]